MARHPKVLSFDELKHIEQREEIITDVLNAIKSVSKFQVGDFLIAFRQESPHNSRRRQILNSYGAPKKYTVLFTDKHGVPYIRELNKNGIPVGQLISPIMLDDAGIIVEVENCQFEIDPDYADAIIMADEEGYDAANIHRAKSEAFKAITQYNKSVKVNTRDFASLKLFLQNLKVGDVVWKSVKTHFTILTISTIPFTHKGGRFDESVNFGTAQDSKGKIFDLNIKVFKWSAIYTGQPRSYNELKNPK
jgi:hypothetical protein